MTKELTISIGSNSFSNVKVPFEGTADEAIVEAKRLYEIATKEKTGIPDKDFDKFIENQLLGQTNLLSVYNDMSDDQKRMVQINKRALKRIKSKMDTEAFEGGGPGKGENGDWSNQD